MTKSVDAFSDRHTGLTLTGEGFLQSGFNVVVNRAPASCLGGPGFEAAYLDRYFPVVFLDLSMQFLE
jgi:hypothetical protein